MKVWVKAAVSVGILALLFALLPWSDVRTAVGRLPGAVWLGVLAGFLAGHVAGAVKWRLLVRASRGRLGAADAARCYAAGLFANVCLPSIVGGDVLRAVLAGRATGRPEAAVLGGIADRALDMTTMALLIGAGALASREALPGWAAQAVTVGVVVTAGTLLVFSPLVVRRRLARWPRRLRRPIGRALVSLRHLARSPVAALAALAISLGMQAFFVLLNAWIGASVGIHVALSVWFMAWPLAKVAGLAPISLGGLAVRDATFGALLVPFGVAMATGVVAHLVWQSVMIVGGLLAGGAWWLMSRRAAAPGAHDLSGALHAAHPHPHAGG